VIDYKALAAEVREMRLGHKVFGGTLEILETLLEGMAEEKPAGWLHRVYLVDDLVDKAMLDTADPAQVPLGPSEVVRTVVPLFLHPAPQPQPCTDPACPCQDGDPCHYVDHGKTKAMPKPQPERQPVSEPTEAGIEEYEILCNDEWVASASGAGARADIAHYLTQYEQDGPCEVYAVTRRLVDRAALAAKDER